MQKALVAIRDSGLAPRLMIDTSHGNSEKDYHRQVLVARDIASRIAQGERAIIRLSMESFLVDGRQDLVDPSRLV